MIMHRPRFFRLRCFAVTLLVLGASGMAHAETPQSFLEEYRQAAKAQNPGFKGFSVTAGESFYKNKHGGDWSCASCHTDNPAATGKHAVTAKVIQPISPNANPERFSDAAKVNKWFKRNCNDVLKRECTAEEKGNVLTYLMSVKS
jgi:hypothetical protein